MIKLHLGCGGSLYGVVPGIDGPYIAGSTIDEWINVDAEPVINPDHWRSSCEMLHFEGGFSYPRVIQHDFRKLNIFPDDFASVAYSHHSLEHVRIDEVVPTLQEWHRVLKVGGRLIVNVPDLLWTAQKIVEKKGDLLWSEGGERTGDWEGGYTKLIYCVFGDQSTDAYQLHKVGFTEPYLRKQTEAAGFRNISIVSIFDMGMGCLEMQAWK